MSLLHARAPAHCDIIGDYEVDYHDNYEINVNSKERPDFMHVRMVPGTHVIRKLTALTQPQSWIVQLTVSRPNITYDQLQ